MKKSQIEMVNQNVLANVPVEELESRLELQAFRPSTALYCIWDIGCDCACFDPDGYCPSLCSVYCACNDPLGYCPTLCSTYCPIDTPCTSYAPIA